MKKLAKQLQKRRRLLLQRYDDEDLHQLRIRLRRMRGLLKQLPWEQAKLLRRELGELAGTTNAARDWDTLAEHAKTLLPAEQFQQLQPALQLQRQLAREKVLRMLRSDDWKAAVQHWKRLEQSEGVLVPVGNGDEALQQLARPLQKVSLARDKALGKGGNRRWHKLRIAVKDLRYCLDGIPKKQRSARNRRMLSLCKELQECLGAWHDSVIHRVLLAELADSIEPDRHRPVVDALDILDRSIGEEGDCLLERVKTLLQQRETKLAFAPVTEGL